MKEKLSNQQLTSWLKLNRLISQNRTTDQILKDSLNDIIQSLGSIKDLFLFISKNAKKNHNKLQLIHQSISKQITKHENQKQIINIKQDKNNNNNNNNKKQKTNVFTIISNESISTICSFIDKTNIRSFKRTSRRHAIICLDEMNKSMVGIINCNQLNNTYNFNIKQMIYNRYKPSIKYFDLYQKWFKQYNIPLQNQLLFDMNIKSVPLLDSLSMKTTQINSKQKKKQYLILDNRQIIILNGDDNARKFNIETDKYQSIQNYKLIILKYFNVFNQSIKTVQYILYNGNITHKQLCHYIEYAFISTNNINNNWYNELKSHLYQMSNEYNKLFIYQHKSNKNMTLVNKKNFKFGNFYNRLFTFQLDVNNAWFNNKFKDIELKCKQNMDQFYLTADKFCKNIIYIRMHFKGDVILLQSVIKHIYESKMNKNKNKNNNTIDLENIFKNMKEKCMEIKISKTSKSCVLRHKISQHLLNGVIEPQYIELFHINNFKSIKWNQEIQEIGEIKNAYYSVVLYDTQSFFKH